MKFSLSQKDLQESLGFCQNVIERRSTLPILSNVLIEAKNKILELKDNTKGYFLIPFDNYIGSKRVS